MIRRRNVIFTIVIITSCVSFTPMYIALKQTKNLTDTKLTPLNRDIRSHVDPFCDEAAIGENNIFFVETSCATTDGIVPSTNQSDSGVRLSLRAACAVEAAARLHPERPVYLAHTCPVRKERIWDGSSAHVQQVLDLPNLRLWPVSMQALLEGTPLEALFRGDFQRSKFPVEHASDLVRLVLLWRYGGTYLDTDVYLVRPLGVLNNFVCVKGPNSINGAAMGFALDETGRSALNATLTEMQETYKPDNYANNGPKLMTRVLKKLCMKKKFNMEKEEDCHGVRLLPPSYFYPVLLDDWRRYFEEEGAEETMKAIRKSIGAHVWNHRSKKFPETDVVNLRSNQPFAQLMREVCPGVVSVAPGSI